MATKKRNPIWLCTAGLILTLLATLLCSCGRTQVRRQDLRVMSYNILHGEGLDGRLDLGRTAEVISLANADVVGLNEVDNNYSDRSRFLDEAKWLADELGMYYVYGWNLSSGDPQKPHLYGNAILSRYPIKSWKNHHLYRHQEDEQRGCVHADIVIGGTEFTFAVTHLDHQSQQARLGQVKDILEILKPIERNIVLMGDFNCKSSEDTHDGSAESTRPIAMVMERFEDCFLIAGSGPGGTSASGSRIDYIFVSPDLAGKIQSCSVLRTPLTAVASDHLPVIADIAISKTKTQ